MKNEILTFLSNIFNAHEGKEQEEKIIENIKNNIEFRGASLWTLIFAIFIASIGLNINSIAVIIGAMLVSPLMGPIVGIGFSLGTNDSDSLKKSIKNLSIATVISIIISAFYFYVSPINNAQSEILARTSPTIYDVLIAFFGGLAGIIGSTRIEKSNIIPGVAIATALMPPLCTAGYGLATGQFNFFFGALYLYTINCIFICLATFLGVEYLKLPSVQINSKRKKQAKRLMISLVIIMIIPATYFAYVFIKENDFNQNVDKYIHETFTKNGYTVIYKDINYDNNPHKIELAFLSKPFTSDEIYNFKEELIKFNIKDTELIIKQNNSYLSEEEWKIAISNIKDESEKLKALEVKLSSGFVGQETTTQIFNEAKAINKKIQKIAIGNLAISENNEDIDIDSQEIGTNILVALIYVESISSGEKEVLIEWLKSRMQNQDILVYFI